jgi:hypothetical protein
MYLNYGLSFTGLSVSFGIVTPILLRNSMEEKTSPNIIRISISQMISPSDTKKPRLKNIHQPRSIQYENICYGLI